MLIETGFQVTNTRLEEKVLLLKLGKLLLLEREDVEQHTNELTDCERRGRPVVPLRRR